MNRKSLFLIGFASAAITFGTLVATVGPRHFHAFRHHHCENSRHSNNDDQGLKKTSGTERQFMHEEHE